MRRGEFTVVKEELAALAGRLRRAAPCWLPSAWPLPPPTSAAPSAPLHPGPVTGCWRWQNFCCSQLANGVRPDVRVREAGAGLYGPT